MGLDSPRKHVEELGIHTENLENKILVGRVTTTAGGTVVAVVAVVSVVVWQVLEARGR
jgi:hypothetical protein